MPTISQRAALAQASRYAGSVIRVNATSYVRYPPHKLSNPKGATTEVRHDNSAKARVSRAADVAEMALHLMDEWSEDRAWSIEGDRQNPYADHSARAMLHSALRVQA